MELYVAEVEDSNAKRLQVSDMVPTQELLDRARTDADGIWYREDGWRYVVHSRTSLYRITRKHMDWHPIDKQFNEWYQQNRRLALWFGTT